MIGNIAPLSELSEGAAGERCHPRAPRSMRGANLVPLGWKLLRCPSRYRARMTRPERKSSKRLGDHCEKGENEQTNLVKDGGPRPEIAPKAPPLVAFPHSFPVRSIVIDTSRRKLYFVVEEGRAYEYPIAVGRTGFSWTGTETVSRKRAWPDWHPPTEMRARDASLPKKMTGGVRNPLGAIALYLGNTEYRIHGTNDAEIHWKRAILRLLPHDQFRSSCISPPWPALARR